jgi:hypothetical protein
MVALKLNHRSAYQDIITQQQTRLGQRGNAFAPDLGVFIPSKGGIANNSSTALTTGLIQAGLQGASVGIQAQMQYGGGSKTPAAGGSGGLMGMGGMPSPSLGNTGFSNFRF